MFESIRKARRLARQGVVLPALVLSEAKRADLKPEYAMALLEMETGIPQRNIFGCDWGPRANGNPPVPPFCQHEVTEERVQALIDMGLANGVGWTQLTYPPLVRRAHDIGGAHKPKYQMRVGFKLLRSHQIALGDWTGFRAYNGSGPAAEAYAAKAWSASFYWKDILDGVDK